MRSRRYASRRCSSSPTARTGTRVYGKPIRCRPRHVRICDGSRRRVTAEARTAAEVARAVADTLERHGLSYAVGGAIALGFYAPPRATVDVDVNVFVPPQERLAEILSALRAEGFVPSDEPSRLRHLAIEEGQFRGTIRGLRLDVFVPAIAFYAQLEERRRRAVLLGEPIWILGPEDLAVLKLMFFRRKDLADVEAMLRSLGTAIDRTYVRRSLIDLVGDDDGRVRALDEIERDVDSGTAE